MLLGVVKGGVPFAIAVSIWVITVEPSLETKDDVWLDYMIGLIVTNATSILDTVH